MNIKNKNKFFLFIPLLLTLSNISCGNNNDIYFTVNFNSISGSEVPSQKIKKGEKAIKPDNPKKENYYFVNWFTNESFSEVYDFSLPVTSSFTLYAKWNQGTLGECIYSLNEDKKSYGVSDVIDENLDCYYILKTYNNLPVNAIYDYAFFECAYLKYIDIPDSINIIGNFAFSNCFCLNNLLLSSNVSFIGRSAFMNCSSLTSFDIPKGITTIEESTFNKCSSLNNIVIPSNVLYINEDAFFSCTSLENLNFSEGLKKIGNSAFSTCYKLSSLSIPSSVIEIGLKAFSYCTLLNSIIVDKNNSVYDSRDDSNAIIETKTNTLIVGCLSSKISKTVIIIGESAFEGCTNLSSLSIPSSIISLEAYAFANCNGLKNIEFSDGLTSIKDYCFYSCSSLMTFILPKTVSFFGKYVLSNCLSLEEIKVDENNTYYNSDSNCNAIIETSSNTLISGCSSTYFPSSVTKIGPAAFYKCSTLNDIILPDSLIEIGDEAFYGCNYLDFLTCPSSLIKIGDNAFNGCLYLTTISLNNKLISIGNSAFCGCKKLYYITLNESLETIGEKAFFNTALYAIDIPKNVKEIGNAAFSNCYQLKKMTVDEENTVYNSKNEANGIIVSKTKTLIAGCICTKLDDVIHIGDYAFDGCSLLSSIDIPNTVTSIGYHAFGQCIFTNIFIPSSITSIGYGAFYSCSKLEEIVVDSNNLYFESRDSNAIYEKSTNSLLIGCRITHISNKTSKISKESFYGQISLYEILIPKSVTTIESFSFFGCSRLVNFSYSGKIEEWRNVSKEDFWHTDCPSNIIHCTDGDCLLD